MADRVSRRPRIGTLTDGYVTWPPNYGPAERFGPYYRQAVRWLGRAMGRVADWLETWSWDW